MKHSFNSHVLDACCELASSLSIISFYPNNDPEREVLLLHFLNEETGFHRDERDTHGAADAVFAIP